MSEIETTPEIFSRGYRAYEGPRAGIRSAMGAVFIEAVQRSLGLRRKFRFKVVPILTILIAYIPPLIFLGVAVIFPAELAGELVDYPGFFGVISVSIFLLSAFVVPEVLGSDRRTGMFGITMASPLNRWQYLASKFGAIIAVMSLVTLLPAVFLVIGYTLLDLGPVGFGGVVETLFNIFVSGGILSIFFALFAMAASTLTDRPLFATAGIIMTIIASGVLTDVVVETTDASNAYSLLSLGTVPNDLLLRVWGENELARFLPGVSSLASFGAWLGYCVLFTAIVILGYRRIEVTK